ncbi:hypothetical protein CL631_02425 [bacterium]|nr:hypothetical protein [bacterium]
MSPLVYLDELSGTQLVLSFENFKICWNFQTDIRVTNKYVQHVANSRGGSIAKENEPPYNGELVGMKFEIQLLRFAQKSPSSEFGY